MQGKVKILMFLILALLVVPLGYAIGIGLYTEEIDFTPNLNANFMGLISNNVGTDIIVELRTKGDLTEYVTFGQEIMEIPAGQVATFTFNIKLPETIKPGVNLLHIGAEDITPSTQGGISAKTAAFMPLKIRAPYPGKYIEASFSTSDIEEHQVAPFSINLISRGNQTIKTISGIIEIFDQENKIATLTLDPIIEVKPGESRAIQAEWDSKGHKIGEYKAKATIDYDDQQLKLDAGFRIGTLLVQIVNYTKEFYKDEINKFDVEIQSSWNIAISNIYGEVEVGKEKIKTLETNLAPWGKTKITAHLDTHDLDLGEHTANIKVYYADKIAQETAKITILPKREKVIELPSKIPSTTILLIAIIILLVIGNTFLIIYFIKHKKPKKTNKK